VRSEFFARDLFALLRKDNAAPTVKKRAVVICVGQTRLTQACGSRLDFLEHINDAEDQQEQSRHSTDSHLGFLD